MKRIAGFFLLLLAALMLFIGISEGMLPPILTGLGFIAVGLVFLTEKKKIRFLDL